MTGLESHDRSQRPPPGRRVQGDGVDAMTDPDAKIWAWFQAQPRDVFCAKCGRFGTRFHKHWGKCERPALPEVES